MHRAALCQHRARTLCCMPHKGQCPMGCGSQGHLAGQGGVGSLPPPCPSPPSAATMAWLTHPTWHGTESMPFTRKIAASHLYCKCSRWPQAVHSHPKAPCNTPFCPAPHTLSATANLPPPHRSAHCPGPDACTDPSCSHPPPKPNKPFHCLTSQFKGVLHIHVSDIEAIETAIMTQSSSHSMLTAVLSYQEGIEAIRCLRGPLWCPPTPHALLTHLWLPALLPVAGDLPPHLHPTPCKPRLPPTNTQPQPAHARHLPSQQHYAQHAICQMLPLPPPPRPPGASRMAWDTLLPPSSLSHALQLPPCLRVSTESPQVLGFKGISTHCVFIIPIWQGLLS